MKEIKIQYRANPTPARFHKSDAFVRGIRGPRGSGKSTACAMELFKRAQQQTPDQTGIRRTRWSIIRNTYRELQDTTLKTWLSWFPEQYFGKFNNSSMIHHIKFNDIDAEFMFRALDSLDDVKKVLSLEVTGAWINEAREIYSREIITGLADAIGRYPALKDGAGPTWTGLIMDTNAMDTEHWWYKLAEEQHPQGWEFFSQPGGLMERGGEFVPNPEAENIKYIPDGYGYYTKRAQGASRDHILVYYCNQYGFMKEGKSVYPEYVDDLHCSKIELNFVKEVPIIIGLDFGLTPAALFAQRLPNGRWIWVDELVTESMGARNFALLLKPRMAQLQREGFKFSTPTGDPAGKTRAQTDEQTCFDILRTEGIEAEPAPSNSFVFRREAVAACLSRIIDGKPGLIVSPKCKVARKAMAGGYHYRRLKVSGEERYQDEPYKNEYSHIAEAGQYAMIGQGEGEVLIEISGNHKEEIKMPVNHYGELGWMQ